MASSLESRINEIVARVAAEVAQSVKDEIAAEVQRAIGGSVASIGTAARGPGRPRKNAAAPAPAHALTSTGKRPRADRSYSDADISKVISVIQSKPGLRPSEYQAESKLRANVFDRIVARLKSDKRIRVLGAGRNTTYSLN